MARTPDPRGNRPAWDDEDDALQRAPAGRGAPPPRRQKAAEPVHTTVKRSWIWIAIIALLVLAVGIAVGIAVVAKRADAPIPVQANGGEAPLISSPGPWKARPADPGGVEVEGQDQVIYEAGDGTDPGGTIDLDALPEEPVARPGSAPTDILPPAVTAPSTVPAAQAPPAAQPPAVRAPAPAPAPTPPRAAPPRPVPPAAAPAAPAAAPTSGATAVQLGAFSTEAAARSAWKTYTTRFGYLRDLTPVITPTKAADKTLYRLRATGAADAADVCKRLRVAGEPCTPV